MAWIAERLASPAAGRGGQLDVVDTAGKPFVQS